MLAAVSRSILIVDDDPIVLNGMRRVLERAGWDCRTAHRADQAMPHIEGDDPPDAVIVDYDLGDHDGLSVLEWMRDHRPSTVRILMTGHDDLPLVVAAINRGEAFKVLRKPFQHLELLEVLEGAFATVERMQKATTERMIEAAISERKALLECLERRQLRFALQPIFHVDRMERPVAFEALLRPFHERFANPAQLLVAVERHNRVLELGDVVFELAASVLPTLRADARLFVNLHPEQLGDPDRLAKGCAALRDHADRVTFEVTERSRLQDIDNWERSVKVVEDGGFELAVDDLGAGYSALTILADLQPRYIKLDMSMVRDLDASSRKQRLIQLIVTFGEATNASVIGEGVETEAELETLKRCGVKLFQGYLLGEPVTLQ
jgi:EAL domain-containing protein (putative c-di-GMP-specific phosphodiesterase class I)